LPLLALATEAPPSRAQGELAVSWADCAPNGVLNVLPNCQFDIGERRLYLSFSPAAAADQVVGWALVLDIASDAETLPDWWQVQPGGCRDGQVVAVLPTGQEGGCMDAWSASGSAVIQSFLYPRPGGDARQLRMIIGVGVTADNAFSLAGGESYLAAPIAIRYAKTVPPGECAGCNQSVCFVFNSAEIVRLPGAPGAGPQPLVTPAPATGNQATWGGSVACAVVPARGRTWGQIKALFR